MLSVFHSIHHKLIACETCVNIGFNVFSLVTCNLRFTNSNLGFGFAMSNSLDKLHIGNSCSQSFHLIFQGQPHGFLFCVHLILFYFHHSLPLFFPTFVSLVSRSFGIVYNRSWMNCSLSLNMLNFAVDKFFYKCKIIFNYIVLTHFANVPYAQFMAMGFHPYGSHLIGKIAL